MHTPAIAELTLADDLTITRMGYGAMQLTGPGVFGPPADRAAAIAVLRAAIELGIDHIDTSGFYGPVIVNELIREALYPYPAGLRIATKVGVRRTATGGWTTALDPTDLVAQVHENLEHLGVESLDVVNLRAAAFEGDDTPIAEQFGALAALREQGLIRHLGLSGVTDVQLTEAAAIAPVVMVQNLYNLAHRSDDDLVDRCADEGIGYAAFFPLGGGGRLRSRTLNDVARRLDASPQRVALAWLLQRSPSMVLIPGTSSITHLRDNIAAAELRLPSDVVAEIDAIGG
ncbi:oxidoreductase [Nocardia arizonensis]|uniref:oxidoreductase n=1 Tax=Nocardia arizonensis TaxID=1141647 RepID=UPI0006D0A590|nr:oxidoreductase [Nocardia arizonensis]